MMIAHFCRSILCNFDYLNALDEKGLRDRLQELQKELSEVKLDEDGDVSFLMRRESSIIRTALQVIHERNGSSKID